MIEIDHYAYQSKMKKIVPAQKMAFTLVTLVSCLILNDPAASLLVIGAMAGYTVLKGGIPWAFFLQLMAVPMAFLVIGVLTVLFNAYDTPQGLLGAIPLFGMWIGISPKSLELALNLFLKALGAVTCLYAMALTTPMTGILSALRRLGLPVLITDLMELIYRFVFVLLETSSAIMTAQHSRLGYADPRTAYRSFGTMLTVLLVRALKRSDALYTALESRGYQGELTVLEEEYTSSPSLLLAALTLNVLLVGVVLLF